MNNSNQHIVANVNWSISFDDRQRAVDLQNKLSAWSKIDLPKIVDRVFNSLCPENETWQIDSLEIDLGDLLEDELISYLDRNFGKELEEQLRSLVFQTDNENHVNILNHSESRLRLFKKYLTLGYMPWHETGTMGINELFVDLINSKRLETINTIKELGKSVDVLKRISYQLKEANIHVLIKEIEPNNYIQIIEFVDEFVEIQKKEPIVQTSEISYKKNLWFWVLDHLLSERGSLYNRVSFMESSIRKMAKHYNQSYESLFEQIRLTIAVLAKTSIVRPVFLQTFMFLAKNIKSKPVTNSGNTLRKKYEKEISFFSRKENRTTRKNQLNLTKLIKDISAKDRHLFREFISDFNITTDEWKIILKQLDTASIQHVLEVLLNKDYAFVVSVTDLVYNSSFTPKRIEHKEVLITAFVCAQRFQKGLFSKKEFFKDFLGLMVPAKDLDPIRILMLFKDLNSNLEEQRVVFEASIALFGVAANVSDKVFIKRELNSVFNHFNARKRKAFAIDSSSFAQNKLDILVYKDPKGLALSLLGISAKSNFSSFIRTHFNNYQLCSILAKGDLFKRTYLVELFAELAKIKGGTINSVLGNTVLVNTLKSLGKNVRSSFTDVLGIVLTELNNAAPFSESQKLVFVNAVQKNSILKKVKFLKLVRFLKGGRNEVNTDPIKQIPPESAEIEGETKELVIWLNRQLNQSSINSVILFEKHKKIRLIDRVFGNGSNVWQKFESEWLDANDRIVSKEELERAFWERMANWKEHKANSDYFFTGLASELNAMGVSILSERRIQAQHLQEQDDDRARFISSLLKNLDGRTADLEEGKIAFFVLLDEHPFYLKEELQNKQINVRLIDAICLEREIDSIVYSFFNSGGIMDTDVRLIYEFLFILISDHSVGLSEYKQKELLKNELFALIKSPDLYKSTLEKLVKGFVEGAVGSRFIKVEDLLISLEKVSSNSSSIFSYCLKGLHPFFGSDSFKNRSVKKEDESVSISKKQIKRLDEIISAIVGNKRELNYHSGTNEMEKDLRDIVKIDPFLFYSNLKSYNWTDRSLVRLMNIAGVELLINAIRFTRPQRKNDVNNWYQVYKTIEQNNLPNLVKTDVLDSLTKLILIAWKSDNWKNIAPNRFWIELMWGLQLKFGIESKKALPSLISLNDQFPLSYQRQLTQLLPKPVVPAVSIDESNQKSEVSGERLVKAYFKENKVDRIPVSNAGIVLVSSYIKTLFDRLELMNEDSFLHKEAQHQAVHYLQYVVNGLMQNEEQHLVLNKVLCGIPLSEPIIDAVLIEDKHVELINGMIKAIINYWPAIGDCTVNGFRGNWLVRDGILTEEQDRWVLTIEKRAYDLLINKSPFSFSIIKNKWMDKPIHVNWAY